MEYDKKETAMQLMMEYLIQHKYWLSEEFQIKYQDLLEKEKFQIKTAFHMGEFNMLNSSRDESFEFENGDEYYNAIHQP